MGPPDLCSNKANLPPSYDASQPEPSSSHRPFQGLYNDPRTSSTESLAPSLPPYEEFERRKLLVIYIHGFMGNDTSFQSFPAHVHKYLKLALSDSHAIHSKIYPRYKTYKSIEIARDNFSKWLEPHESPNTDVVLIGHSMGGLLSADVVLMHGYFKHRILGQVALDAPLLGMHPGIVVSGISSLFRKNEPPKRVGEPDALAPQSPDIAGLPSPSLSTYSVPSTLSETSSSLPQVPAPFARPAPTFEPNFDYPFPNDVRIQERSWWKNVVHFVQKHNSEGLIDAATKHVMSHMEFGSSLFDIKYLKTRYDAVRKLEDIDDLKNHGFLHVPPQVRFVQYYTICNGYPKPPKEPESKQKSKSTSDSDVLGPYPPMYPSLEAHTPVHHVSEETRVSGAVSVSSSHSERSSLELLSPEPIPDQDQSTTADHATHYEGINDTKLDGSPTAAQTEGSLSGSPPSTEVIAENKSEVSESLGVPAPPGLDFDLPAVPDLPSKPEPPNLALYSDKDAKKQAEKEGKRAQKAYDQAVKDRQKAIKEREKIIEKRQKKKAQEEEKRAKEEQKRAKGEEKKKKKDEAAAAAARASSTSASLLQSNIETPTLEEDTPKTVRLSMPADAMSELSLVGSQKSPELEISPDGAKGKKKEEKRKERKFCNLAKVDGQVDSKWVQVFMKDMDEVAAHTGLFFAGEHYDTLVGDVGNTITEWVQSDMTKRAILMGVD
ncbi:hypothetical protein F5Y18DRAFT_445174 [Xylariaceae sp. FL1019]|nr:hypothetical protein F5Y18DRAFT_445174 [Xylariaceae sp. FL1019]